MTKRTEVKMMKLGLIRCLQTEDMCPATTDLKVIQAKKGAFEGITDDIELIGINTCGGCPGKKSGYPCDGDGRPGSRCNSFSLLYHQGESDWFCLSSCSNDERGYYQKSGGKGKNL
jgi:predicted metal-binding protein